MSSFMFFSTRNVEKIEYKRLNITGITLQAFYVLFIAFIWVLYCIYPLYRIRLYS